jgi:hypothetical protein
MPEPKPVSNVNVLISYDLDGHQDEFKAEMEKLSWKYSKGGRPLPWSTCWAPFEAGISEVRALQIAKDDIAKAAAAVSTKFRTRVERVAIMSACVPPGEFVV